MAELVNINEHSRTRQGAISVCMIARDEQSCIAEALGSVRDLADEMIVVDTGSADDTILEAKRLGARVYETAWRNDFSEARNFGLSKAHCRWVLVLDADEALAPDDLARIRELVSRDERAAYIFEQRTYLCEADDIACEPVGAGDGMARGVAYFSDRQVRLIRNEPAIRYACEIHEHLDESLLEAGMPVRESGVIMHHYGRLRESGRVHRKALLWCGLGRDELEAYPAHPRYLYEMAVQFLELGIHKAAARHLAAALSVAPASWRLWNAWGLVHIRAGERDLAVACFRKALRKSGGNAGLYNNMGVALMENREPAEALLWFERALALENDNSDILRNAAAACALIGECDRGCDYIERSLAIDPFAAHSHAVQADLLVRRRDSAGASRVLERMRFLPDMPFKVYLKIIHIYIRMHRIDDANTVVRRAIEEFPDRNDLLYLAGKIAEMGGEDERAASLYRRALSTSPGHSGMLSSLGCVLDRQERFREALAVFREALRNEPASTEIEVNIGIILDKLGHSDEAGRCFARAMEKGERSGFVYNALGCHHALLSRFGEAFTCFSKAVELEADNPLYYRNLGLACERMELYAQAAVAYERMALIDRDAASFARERLARFPSTAGSAAH